MPSSVVRDMIYDASVHRLRIIYVSGNIYDYLHVPPTVYAAMKASGSKGTYLNRKIKGHYDFKKIK